MFNSVRRWLKKAVIRVFVTLYVIRIVNEVLDKEHLKLVKKYGENYDPLCEYTSVSLSPIVVFLVFLSLYLLGGFG